MRIKLIAAAALPLALTLVHCKREKEEPTTEQAAPAPSPTGGGPPITAPEVTLSSDPKVIERGSQIFVEKGCNGCHKIGGGKLVGPDLKGVTARRDKQWIAKMILHPNRMVKEDPTARELIMAHMTEMPNQHVSEEELGPLISYLKANE